MKFLPIVERELRVASRRQSTYWMRSIIAAVVILIATWVFLMTLNEPPREVGMILFQVLAGGALIMSLASGIRSTSDCLSEEKRDGTLGLLFLTNLRGYDVVLGKLVANSLGAFYGLLALVPMLALPLLMGGTAPAEFARVSVALVNTMFLSLSVGLFCSSLSQSSRRSAGATLLLLLLFSAGCPALGAWLDWILEVDYFQKPLLLPSPIFCHVAGLEFRLLPARNAYFWSLALIHGCAWVFLLAACVIAPRAWQDRPETVRTASWKQWWRLLNFGGPEEARRFRAALLDKNPFFWLASRARLGPAQIWMALVILTGLWIWGAMEFRRDWFDPGVYVATALCVNSMFKAWIASESCRQICEERRIGSLELLLTTPLSVRDILRGQQLSLRRFFLKPMLLVIGVELVMFFAGAKKMHGNDLEVWVAVWMCGLILLVADALALFWVGMWVGIATKNPKRAFSGTVLRVLILPWVAYGLFLMVVGLMEVAHVPSPDWETFVGMWFVLGLLFDGVYGFNARTNLLNRFRVLATQRFSPTRSLWERILGRTEGPSSDRPSL